jgi:hypothetical protein
MRICFLLLVLPSLLLADGKMYRAFEKVPADIPYQRAVIFHRDGQQTMVLQSKYELPPGAPYTDLGWVVPLPAPPKVASVVPSVADLLFTYMDLYSTPIVIRIFSFENLFLAVWILWFIFLVGAGNPARRDRVIKSGFILLLGSFLAAIALPGFARGPRGVEILSEKRAGVYDVTVVRAHESEALLEWLRSHNFEFGDSDRAVFDAHIAVGGCFVAARLNPDKETQSDEIHRNGLVAPLVFQFASEQPFYPLALTGTGGHKTEVLLYLLSDRPHKNDGRLPLRFSGSLRGDARFQSSLDRFNDTLVSESGFANAVLQDFPHLCKFKGILDPDQMREDLLFRPAPGQADFRENRILLW